MRFASAAFTWFTCIVINVLDNPSAFTRALKMQLAHRKELYQQHVCSFWQYLTVELVRNDARSHVMATSLYSLEGFHLPLNIRQSQKPGNR